MTEYEIIKEFSIPDYIIAHKRKYGWTEYNKSCKEFQEDMNVFGLLHPFREGEYYNPILNAASANFLIHAVEFGFMREKKEEVFYKIRDMFQVYEYGEGFLCQVGPGKCCIVLLTGAEPGNRIKDPIGVVDVHKITQDELNQMSEGYIIKKI